MIPAGSSASMDFGLSETQRLFREEVGRFVEDRIVGENLEWDAGENFPQEELYEPMAEVGLTSMFLPEEAGGQDVDFLTSGIIFEQVGRGDVGVALLLLAQNSLNRILYRHGDEAQREVAREVGRGETKLALTATEPEHGSDLRTLETTAERREDGWVFDGKKTASTGLRLADYTVTLARIRDGDAGGGDGGGDAGGGDDGATDGDGGEDDEIGMFLLPLSIDGAEVSAYHGMGCEVEGWGELFLDDAVAPADARIGDEDGFKLSMEMFDYTRPWICLYSIGAAQQTLDETKSYLTDREAFGRPLASFEGPMFEVAEMETLLSAARLKSYEALWKMDAGQSNAKDAAMVKWWVPELAADVIEQCMVLHGHYGYSKDFGIEKRLRDVVGQRIADGTPHIQKIIVGREIFGRDYLPY